MTWVSHSSCKATPQKDRTAINPAVQPSERFQQGSKTVPFFRGVHGYVSPVVPGRLKPVSDLLGPTVIAI